MKLHKLVSRSENLFRTCSVANENGDLTVKLFHLLECYYAVMKWPITEKFRFNSRSPHGSTADNGAAREHGTNLDQ